MHSSLSPEQQGHHRTVCIRKRGRMLEIELKKMQSDWQVVKQEGEVVGSLDLFRLSPLPIIWGQEDGMGYHSMMELGRQINDLSGKDLTKLRNRLGEWVILFPGTQCQDRYGDIFIPSLRHVTEIEGFGIISMSWRWDWFSYQVYKQEEALARMGRGFHPLEDCNNSYRKGFGYLAPATH
jgi:hypothetical protein